MVALVPNFMDRGRVEAAVRSAGASIEYVATPAQLSSAVGGASDEGAGAVNLAVVDLAVAGVMGVLASLGTVTVGFGSHVDRDLLRRAKEAGCDEVVARSALSHRLSQALASVAGGDDPHAGR